MTTETANQAVESYADTLREFCELVREHEASWDAAGDVPTFEYDVTAGPTIRIPYKAHPATGDECRETKLYRRRQEKLGIYVTLRREYENALWFLAASDHTLRDFMGVN